MQQLLNKLNHKQSLPELLVFPSQRTQQLEQTVVLKHVMSFSACVTAAFGLTLSSS